MEYKEVLREIESNNYSGNYNDFIMDVIIKVANCLNTMSCGTYEIRIFSKMKNYIRYIAIYIYIKNIEVLNGKNNTNIIKNIYHSYRDLLLKIGLIENTKDNIVFKEEFKIQSSDYNRVINCEDVSNETIKNIIQDYKEVFNILSPKEGIKLGKILEDKRFRYIKEIVRYLYELRDIKFDSKIAPSFEEDFYTNLGELAFNLYTKPAYINVLKEIECKSILDIGCGNGNFIDLFCEQYSNSKIIGVERQNKVYQKLTKKYNGKNNVVILNEDVLDIILNEEIDLVNISYMLFYLSFEQKIEIFKTLSILLSKNGKIIVCQYYPKFEEKQEVISRHLGTWNLINKFKYSVANNILYAEVLLNDALRDFNQAEDFKEFEMILKETGLQIEKIYPADETYYSYFILITRRN